MVRLAIDFENPGTEWWEGGGRDLWEALSEGFGENAVVVESSIAERGARVLTPPRLPEGIARRRRGLIPLRVTWEAPRRLLFCPLRAQT